MYMYMYTYVYRYVYSIQIHVDIYMDCEIGVLFLSVGVFYNQQVALAISGPSIHRLNIMRTKNRCQAGA